MGRLFLAEIKRSWIQFIRYPSEAITLVITFVAIFVGIFYGFQYMAGGASQFGDRLDKIIVSYLLWSLTLYALTGMAWAIQGEAQAGTLEQVFLSPYNPIIVFLLRALADLLVQLAVIVTAFVVIMFITQRKDINFTPLAILPLITVMLATYGLGYVMGGLTLVFKRIMNLIQLSQFAMIFLVMTPVEDWQGNWRIATHFLPMMPGAGMIRALAINHAPFDAMQLLVSFINGLAYFLLGMYLFHLAERHAKLKGLLGGY